MGASCSAHSSYSSISKFSYESKMYVNLTIARFTKGLLTCNLVLACITWSLNGVIWHFCGACTWAQEESQAF